jgi:pullulanase
MPATGHLPASCSKHPPLRRARRLARPPPDQVARCRCRAGAFKLYYSAGGAIAARGPGARCRAADGALALARFEGSVPRPWRSASSGRRRPGAGADENDAAKPGRAAPRQLVLVQEDARHGARRHHAAGPGALDDLYAGAAKAWTSSASRSAQAHRLQTVGADRPAGRRVHLQQRLRQARAAYQMRFDDATGAWSARLPGDLSGKYYKYAVDVRSTASAASCATSSPIPTPSA